MSADKAATAMVGEAGVEEIDVDVLLHTIQRILKDNAIEVWQTYRQISLG